MMSGAVGEGMPVRVRALGVSDRWCRAKRPGGQRRPKGFLCFRPPSKTCSRKKISCPEVNGACEGWDAWIRR